MNAPLEAILASAIPSAVVGSAMTILYQSVRDRSKTAAAKADQEATLATELGSVRQADSDLWAALGGNDAS